MGYFVLNSGKKVMTENIREEMMALLVAKAEKLGRPPQFEEVRNDLGMPNPNAYAYYYGCFTDASRHAYFRVKKNQEAALAKAKEMETAKVEISNSVPENVSGNIATIGIAGAGERRSVRQRVGRRYTPEGVEGMLKGFYRKNGRLPKQKEVKEAGLPSWTTLVAILGPRCDWEEKIFDREI